MLIDAMPGAARFQTSGEFTYRDAQDNRRSEDSKGF